MSISSSRVLQDEVDVACRTSAGTSRRPLRVAVVVNCFPTLSETFIFNKVVGLAERGVQVTVIAHDRSADARLYQGRLESLTIRLRCLRGWPALINGLRDFAYLFCHEPRLACQWFGQAVRQRGAGWSVLLGALAARKCDVVHFELSGLGVAYLPALDLLRPARIFVSCRGTAEKLKPLTDSGRDADLEQLFRLVDRVHCVSQDMLDYCKRYGLATSKAFVNRPAVQVEDFTQEPRVAKSATSAPLRICSIGRLHWIKGLEFALLAVKLAKDAGAKVVWEIVGDGPERDKLVFMIHSLGLADTVTLVGRLDSRQVKQRLENCDTFMLPSLSEGISNSALEAMAMQVPVISTRSGGMGELITDGHDGLLVDAYAPNQITNCILRLAHNTGLRKQLGRNARQTILDRFSIERQVDCLLGEYAQSVAGGRSISTGSRKDAVTARSSAVA